MQEARLNLWDESIGQCVRFVTTNLFVKNNGEAVMGRGCAYEATRLYPHIAMILGNAIRNSEDFCHTLIHDEVLGTICSFPVKHHWREKADIELIKASCYDATALMDIGGYHKALLPRPGCGNGQLYWENVKPEIEDILDDRFTVVTI